MQTSTKDLRIAWLRVFSLIAALVAPVAVHPAPVLLISIDGLHPNYVLEADKHGLEIPNLRALLREGSYAQGVEGVVPTVTYPSHTTLMTGTAPAEHGILSNTPFDPLGRNQDGWYWYAQDIRVPTLWQAAADAGLATAAVNWPVTVGDRSIRYLLPEFWRAMTADDLKLIQALSHPVEMVRMLDTHVGPFTDGWIDTLAADEIRTEHARAILAEYAPDMMAVHLIALDGVEHREGPYVQPAYAMLEALDTMVGAMHAAALRNDPATVLAIVSDHGFIATHTAVNLRTQFVETGLIKLKKVDEHAVPTIEAWEAQVWSGGGVAAVVLREPDNTTLHDRVRKLLHTLQADRVNGIASVVEGDAITERGAYTGAAFLVEFEPGYYLGSALRGPLLSPATSRGTHGYLPERTEMHAAFFISGQGIAAGRNLGIIDMRAIAPTLARILGVKLSQADLMPLTIDASE